MNCKKLEILNNRHRIRFVVKNKLKNIFNLFYDILDSIDDIDNPILRKELREKLRNVYLIGINTKGWSFGSEKYYKTLTLNNGYDEMFEIGIEKLWFSFESFASLKYKIEFHDGFLEHRHSDTLSFKEITEADLDRCIFELKELKKEIKK